MWWWLSIASAVPCEAEALTQALLPPVREAADALGRSAEQAEALVAVDVAGLTARCVDRETRAAVAERPIDLAAIHDRASLFLLAGHPSTWTVSEPLDVGVATVWLPPALALTATRADASASLDLLGLHRVRVAVRPGLPVPPPEPPEDPRERREWKPPIPPFVEVNTAAPPVWTASCWGPQWAAPLLYTVCGSVEAHEPEHWPTVALPSTRLAVNGPPDPAVESFRTLTWVDYGVTAQLYVYTDSEKAQAHADQAPLHAWVPGSTTALLTCSAQWPASQPVAQHVCDSLTVATPEAVEALRRLDRG